MTVNDLLAWLLARRVELWRLAQDRKLYTSARDVWEKLDRPEDLLTIAEEGGIGEEMFRSLADDFLHDAALVFSGELRIPSMLIVIAEASGDEEKSDNLVRKLDAIRSLCEATEAIVNFKNPESGASPGHSCRWVAHTCLQATEHLGGPDEKQKAQKFQCAVIRANINFDMLKFDD